MVKNNLNMSKIPQLEGYDNTIKRFIIEKKLSKKVLPISPEALKNSNSSIHPNFLEAVNVLIKENWNGRSAKVFQSDIRCKVSSEILKNIFPADVIAAYEKMGWKIIYDNNVEFAYMFEKNKTNDEISHFYRERRAAQCC